MLPMMHMGIKKTRRTAVIAALAAGTVGLAAPLAAGSASAAPQTTPSPDKVHQLKFTNQTPSIGVKRSGAVPAGYFVAPLAAAAVGDNDTVVWLEPMPKDACKTTLSDAKIAVTWKNAGKTDDATFAACKDGKPAASPLLETGKGTVSFTVTVLGHGGDTFTLSPGTATLTR